MGIKKKRDSMFLWLKVQSLSVDVSASGGLTGVTIDKLVKFSYEKLSTAIHDFNLEFVVLGTPFWDYILLRKPHQLILLDL
ncbi:hypothetical protein E3N88_13700 [Mikania micrantha]|uniref:Uncharacterized protein n=1 Tax=Mikania micrantha TaxID=192012 RepID=A0A5N6NZ79_9ASTR|nr:hypothetical protein E3N88_13700 [Mikania micrantha]